MTFIIASAVIFLVFCIVLFFIPSPEAELKAKAVHQMNSRMIGDKTPVE